MFPWNYHQTDKSTGHVDFEVVGISIRAAFFLLRSGGFSDSRGDWEAVLKRSGEDNVSLLYDHTGVSKLVDLLL